MNNLIKIIFVLIFLLPVCTQGQAVTWQKYYNYENGNDFAYDAIQTFDGGYLLTGNGRSSSVFRGCFLLKLDLLGNVEWKKLIGSQSELRSVKKVEQLSDSGFLFVGSCFDSLLLFKTDSKGEVEWEKKFCEDNGEARGFSFRTTKDNSIIMCGDIFFSSPSLRIYPYVIKTDMNGNLKWKRYYDDMLNLIPFDIISIKNSEYVFCTSEYLRKLDSVGNIINTISYWSGPGSLALKAMTYVEPDIIYSCGVSELNSQYSFHALKVDVNDSLYWSNSIVSPENVAGQGDGICYKDGNLYMTGTYNMKGVVPFVKVSSSGETKIYNLITESMAVESYGNSIKPANDGGFIIGATTRFGPTFSYKFLAIKTDSNGFAPKLVNVQSNSEQTHDFTLYQNFPNPFNPVTAIKYYLPTESLIILEVFDITGKKIEEIENERKSSGYYTVKFNGINLSSGIYFYKLTINNEGFFYKSVIKKMLIIK